MPSVRQPRAAQCLRAKASEANPSCTTYCARCPDSARACAEVFNPTCNNVVLDSYSLLFISSTQGVPGDGDWSEATSITFPAGTTLAVRVPRSNRAARKCTRHVYVARRSAAPPVPRAALFRTRFIIRGAAGLRLRFSDSRAARSWRAARRSSAPRFPWFRLLAAMSAPSASLQALRLPPTK